MYHINQILLFDARTIRGPGKQYDSHQTKFVFLLWEQPFQPSPIQHVSYEFDPFMWCKDNPWRTSNALWFTSNRLCLCSESSHFDYQERNMYHMNSIPLFDTRTIPRWPRIQHGSHQFELVFDLRTTNTIDNVKAYFTARVSHTVSISISWHWG